jgi:hypothetical protein
MPARNQTKKPDNLLAIKPDSSVCCRHSALAALTDIAMRISMHMHISPHRLTMKTERVTLLTSPDFKAFLNAEAQREGVSVAELIRTRCERRPTDEEAVLVELTGQLRKAVGEAKRSMKDGLDEAQAALRELQAKRAGAAASGKPVQAPPARRSRKVAGASA